MEVAGRGALGARVGRELVASIRDTDAPGRGGRAIAAGAGAREAITLLRWASRVIVVSRRARRTAAAAPQGRGPMVAWWILCLVSALRIYGFHHPDELGQVTGFALAKLGVVPTSGLPWEYAARIRPWLQPALDYLVLSPIVAVTGFDFVLTERVMVLVQLVLLTAALPLYLRAAPDVPRSARSSSWWRWGVLATAGLWFLPGMLVRHSSEAFSTVLLGASLGAWAILEKRRGPLGSGPATEDHRGSLGPGSGAEERGRSFGSWPAAEDGRRLGASLAPRVLHELLGSSVSAGLGSGLLAGLAFCGRFQVGLFVAGFWLARAWADLRGEKRLLGPLAAFAAGVLAALGIGLAVDTWGYGQPTIAAARYFAQNVLHDRASAWGREPWSAYLLWGALLTLNPLVWLWLGRAVLEGWHRPFPRALAVGTIVFLAVHAAIPHKEARFLLPLVAPGLLLVWHLFADLAAGRARPGWWLGGPGWLKAVAVANLVALAAFTAFGLVAPKNRIDLELRELPAGSTVLASFDLYDGFDELVDSPAPRLTEYALPAERPPGVRFAHVRRDHLAAACRERPEAFALLTNRDPGGPILDPSQVRAAIAAWPPPALPLPAALAGVWRHAIIRCPDLLAAMTRAGRVAGAPRPAALPSPELPRAGRTVTSPRPELPGSGEDGRFAATAAR